MAGPTGFSFFHGFHRHLGCTLLGLEQVGVAFIAAEHPGMRLMWESDIAGICIGILDISGVTGGAVILDAECRATVVAGPTGGPVCHCFHGGVIAVILGLKDVGMAFVAAERADMYIVAENHLADVFSLDRDFTGSRVTGGAVASNTEGLLPIVTDPAGFAGFHVGHGEERVLLGDDMKNTIVAGWTIIADGLHLQVCIVAELDIAYRFGLQVDFVFDPASVKN